MGVTASDRYIEETRTWASCLGQMGRNMQDRSAPAHRLSILSEDMFSAVAYISPIPAATMLLIPSVARSGRVRFHACQSVLLSWFMLCAVYFLHLGAGVQQLLDQGTGASFNWTARLLCMFVWGLAAIRTASGRNIRIPLLSGLAQQQANCGVFKRFAAAPERCLHWQSSDQLSGKLFTSTSVSWRGARGCIISARAAHAERPSGDR